MKKVPKWIREVLYFSNVFPCADTRLDIIEELMSGQFDYEEFKDLIKDSYRNRQECEAAHNQFEALESGCNESMAEVMLNWHLEQIKNK